MADRVTAVEGRPLVVCLAGPTAAGKTEVAAELVQRFPFEIISVDSALVYRYMNIGTAKPGPDVRAVAPHRLIDIRDPWQRYSAGEFCADARALIADIHARGRLPLLVGGTMLYFRALQQGLAPLPTADQALRDELDRRAARFGWPALHAELAALDPTAARRIKPTDRQRLQRALEVIHLTGEPISRLQRVAGPASDFEFLRVALLPSDRTALHQRIEARFFAMLDAGFVAEVEGLRAMPEMNAECTSMRAVGYRQLWSHLDGEVDLRRATQNAIVATRRLAKRQLTWLRGESGGLEFDCQAANVAVAVADAIAPHLPGYRA